ncbi:MAG TPA: class I SAM-dependent methyltransferase [Pyrinomonadaceae bacterium]|nr:class I SAM-dependent methyltransferase [Pyrinomonadaceae bacterium]
MSRTFDLVKWTLALGSGDQNFLGAKWVPGFLRRLKGESQKKWALRLLSMSPHYFIDGTSTKLRNESTDEFLTRVFDVIAGTRDEIYEKALSPYLRESDIVIDYGSGPGFVAAAVSPYVMKIFALDISDGALACGKILNGRENVQFENARDAKDAIPEGGIDAVYSYAVVQHMTDEVFREMLDNCRSFLVEGGKLILHVQLPDETWKTESEWRRDGTAKGKLKFKYGLHCFGRTEETFREMLAEKGFDIVEIKEMETLFGRSDDELASQRLIAAVKR